MSDAGNPRERYWQRRRAADEAIGTLIACVLVAIVVATCGVVCWMLLDSGAWILGGGRP